MARKFVGAPASGASDLITKGAVDLSLLAKADRASEASSSSIATVGPTRIPIGVDGQYAAFPSITRLTDGRLIMVWYQATNHAAARDGDVLSAVSADRGKTWSAPSVAVSGTGDYRDPAIRLISNKLYLTYFKGTSSNAADGCFLRISPDDGATWGSEIRIDSGQQYSAITAPVVNLGSQLMVVWYGKTLTADTNESIWGAKSSDGGLTWGSPIRLVDGVALGFKALEPWMSKSGNTLVVMYRVNNAQDVGRVISTDNGATWSSHSTVINSATGRPTTTYTSDGTLIVAYRSLSSPLSAASGLVRFSRDNGETWSGPRVLEHGSPKWWLYSDFVEVDPGVLLVATAIEESSTAARISCRYVTLGASRTPFGDPANRRAIVTPFDIADDFDRPDSSTVGYATTGQLWDATSGLVIRDGCLASSGTGIIGFRYALVDAKSVNLEIETEWRWANNAGIGIVFRWVDSANHLYVTSETSGANFRLYQRSSGTPTQLQSAAYPLNTSVFHRIRVVDNGGVIRVYADDALVLTHVLAAGTSSMCGLQASTVGTSDHQFRYFTVRRRGALV